MPHYDQLTPFFFDSLVLPPTAKTWCTSHPLGRLRGNTMGRKTWVLMLKICLDLSSRIYLRSYEAMEQVRCLLPNSFFLLKPVNEEYGSVCHFLRLASNLNP